MNNVLNMQLALPTGSLDLYIQSVNKIPMLSAEQERALAERFRNDDDIDAARQLVMAHLRFVVKVARGYSGYGLPQADLIRRRLACRRFSMSGRLVWYTSSCFRRPPIRK